MKFEKIIKYFLALFPLIVLVSITFLFYIYFTPTEVVDYVGVENAYLLMFVFAFLGGLTTLNMVPYYSVLLLLANSGVEPIFLGPYPPSE